MQNFYLNKINKLKQKMMKNNIKNINNQCKTKIIRKCKIKVYFISKYIFFI